MMLLTADQLLQEYGLHSFTGGSTFGALSESSILWLLRNGKIHYLNKGDCIFSHGDRGDSFHVILKGQVDYYKYHHGRYGFIRDYNAGEQIGFMSLIALHDRVGRGEAHQGTITLEIDSALFYAFHEYAPMEFGILMMNLARDMARTLRIVDNLLVEDNQERRPG